MFNKLQLARHMCTFPSYSKDMAAEHWGSGTSVGERSLNPCFSIVRQQLTEIGGKMIILTGFGKPLAPKLFFQVSHVYQMLSQACGISFLQCPALECHGTLRLVTLIYTSGVGKVREMTDFCPN